MKALVLLGCPETPSQTPMAVYVFNKLTKMGYDVTIAANPAASKLVKISDPEELYHLNLVDLERLLGEINEGDFDLLVGFVHKDAAASFFVTFDQILDTKSLALVFSRDIDEVEEFVNMIEESGSNAKITAVRAFHNPSPIKACEQNAANAPVNNTSLPRYFLLFFSLLSRYMVKILKPISIVPSTNTINPIRPAYPKSNP